MKRVIPFLGTFGLGALLAGVMLFLFQPDRKVFWASFLIAGLAFSIFYLGTEWRQVAAFLKRRSARYGANVTAMAAAVAGILVALNYLANRHNKRWDLTANKQFTLADQSVKILQNLDRDLQLVVFDRRENAQSALDLLEQYRYHNKRVSVDVVDQEAEPARVAKYKTTTEATIPFGTIIIDSGPKVERVSTASEQEITNAIIRALKETKKKIYFLEGHGEKSPDESSAGGLSIIKTKLEESNYEVAKFHPLQAMKEGKVELPGDMGALVVAGPQRDYLPAEVDALRDYLKRGGKTLVLLDPEMDRETPNLVAFVNEWGVEVGNDVVIDSSGVGQLFGFGPEVPLATSYGFHSITDKFGNVATVFPLVRTVKAAGSTKDGVSVTNLLNTSSASWAETDLAGLKTGTVRPDDGQDATGPLSLGVAVTVRVEGEAAKKEAAAEGGDGEPVAGDPGDEDRADSEKKKPSEGRAVVVGDSDFIINSLAGAPVGNRDLFLNMVNWVAEDEDLMAIRPREASDRRLEFENAQQQKNLTWLALAIFPGIFVVAGIYVWWGRRV
jgi:ABC-type uncharacterized transport system involved in gliding motility auxiliary subunit